MIPDKRLTRDFFTRDVLDVAPDMIGKNMMLNLGNEAPIAFRITEVEAYRGEEDKACHASKGRTARTEMLFHEGGRLYIYLIYGMYWMLNIVTGFEGMPQAVLIRGAGPYSGPGKITKALGINNSLHGEDVVTSEKLWFEDSGDKPLFNTGPRIGVDYAGDYWKSRPWRYYI